MSGFQIPNGYFTPTSCYQEFNHTYSLDSLIEEILVCPGTDPAWNSLYLAAGGPIMEVGSMMTHGSAVAREYGISTVVGVTQATTRLKTGQVINLNGNTGKITIAETPYLALERSQDCS